MPIWEALPMLEIADLSVSYGRHLALSRAALNVSAGEIVVLLGANGAGKSTLLKAVAGMIPAHPGASVQLDGQSLMGQAPHRIVDRGLALVPEGRGVFGELSVAETLSLGAYPPRARAADARTREAVLELFPRLAERLGQQVRTMSGGEQQMVAIGRALMSAPTILLLDEPSLGLSPLLSQELFQSLRRVRGTGLGILLVEQNARLSLEIGDRAYVMAAGVVSGGGSAADALNDDAVQRAYLGAV
jgi:branched-chain amino acid transport system ATP-binding protein